MKRTFTLVLLLMTSVVLFSSCQKDEDKIIGTWDMDVNMSTGDGLSSYAYWEVSMFKITFNESGTYNAAVREEGHYESLSGTYSLSGNQLIFIGDINGLFTIDELSRKKLVLTTYNYKGDRSEHWEFNKVK